MVVLALQIHFLISEKFLKNSGDHQSRIIINIFEKCTDIQIDEFKFKEIIHKIMP